ncbi:carbonyl reductase, putative [Talaromyces stipitatus ATCC 10500]|uniref:Carbonyl reductase, putative n=1 Tax=Talaromyces stipitatus (strain ATCC 10500 / CBS 375.48 / QM 6759 / NRRL 1006) TaxID=441959 RepID=B8MG44_TALSN|nr:carbonyl reductase, putative [Talaromyces stipitatus ATCC 10500]EED15911.1 carbonyl reductase, putative [Talaromyces stipitatus ATCC 10500]
MLLQPHIPELPKYTSLEGRTVLVTGGTNGLGYESARQFLTFKAPRLIITARNAARGVESVQALRADPDVIKGNPNAIIDMFPLDLDDYKSVTKFCDKVKSEAPDLDVLVCNAGISQMDFKMSASGHEQIMQVNCYSNFLVALELLPVLRATAAKKGQPSHLTFVGSAMQTVHSFASNPIPPSENVLDFLDNAKNASKLKRYNDSKLAVNAFVRYIATKVSSSEVIINDFCPGAVPTNLEHNTPWLIKKIVTVLKRTVGRSIQEGGRTVVYASILAGTESHGKFLQHNKVVPGPPYLDEDAGKEFTQRLWTDLLAELKTVDPQITTWM